MKNYFVNRYGAINDIDFSPIIEEIVNRKGEESWTKFKKANFKIYIYGWGTYRKMVFGVAWK